MSPRRGKKGVAEMRAEITRTCWTGDWLDPTLLSNYWMGHHRAYQVGSTNYHFYNIDRSGLPLLLGAA